MDIQHAPNDFAVELTEKFGLALREQRPDDAHKILEQLAEYDAKIAAQPVFATALALARNDAIGALHALQDSGSAVDGLRAICLHVLEDPTWQGIAESVVENSKDPAAREAMSRLLGREPDLP